MTTPKAENHEVVLLLVPGRDGRRVGDMEFELSCALNRDVVPGRRVVFSDELNCTFLVTAVSSQSDRTTTIRLRRARPIIRPDFVRRRFSDGA